ncbi:MAG: transcription antitermination factor NusB [Candidatus Pacebacteria bacterium]|nr:transcription antitermination factor NusB [Candidatus Paceibacterota bacterium]
MSSRHLSRSIAMQSLYEWDFYNKERPFKNIIEKNIQEFGPGLKDQTFSIKLAQQVIKYLPQLDNVIEKAAPQWPIQQISIIDRNVLRIGLYELLYGDKKAVPPKVAINEAIELAKNFGGESSGKFVNGVLGTIFKEVPELWKKEKSEQSSQMPEEILSGGLVYRKNNEKYQFALVFDAFGFWTFPKGHLEENETFTQALLRELEEEIGLKDLRIIKELGYREYVAKDPEKGKVKRKVTDFLLEASGNTDLKVEKSGGIRDGKWFDADKVLELRGYKECESALKIGIEYIQQKIKNE